MHALFCWCSLVFLFFVLNRLCRTYLDSGIPSPASTAKLAARDIRRCFDNFDEPSRYPIFSMALELLCFLSLFGCGFRSHSKFTIWSICWFNSDMFGVCFFNFLFVLIHNNTCSQFYLLIMHFLQLVIYFILFYFLVNYISSVPLLSFLLKSSFKFVHMAFYQVAFCLLRILKYFSSQFIVNIFSSWTSFVTFLFV